MENTGAGVTITDVEGRFVFVNRALCEVVGYASGELLGRPFEELLHPGDRERILTLFTRALTDPA